MTQEWKVFFLFFCSLQPESPGLDLRLMIRPPLRLLLRQLSETVGSSADCKNPQRDNDRSFSAGMCVSAQGPCRSFVRWGREGANSLFQPFRDSMLMSQNATIEEWFSL